MAISRVRVLNFGMRLCAIGLLLGAVVSAAVRSCAQTLTASASTSPTSATRQTGEMCVSTMVQLFNSDEAPPSGVGGGSNECPNTGTVYSPVCPAHSCITCSAANNNIQGFCTDTPNSVCKQDGTAQCGMQMPGFCGVTTNSDGRPVCACKANTATQYPYVVETCVPS